MRNKFAYYKTIYNKYGHARKMIADIVTNIQVRNKWHDMTRRDARIKWKNSKILKIKKKKDCIKFVSCYQHWIKCDRRGDIWEGTIKITIWNADLKRVMQIHYLSRTQKHELASWEICAIMAIQNYLLLSNPKMRRIGKHVRYNKANILYIVRLKYFFCSAYYSSKHNL